MEPLTLLLLLGGGWLLTRGSATPSAVSPAVPASPAVTTSASSPIQYQGMVPGPRGLEDVTASPIEDVGFIPPFVATPDVSAVVLSVPGTSLGGLSCACGLGDYRSDLNALHASLKALRQSFRARLAAALQARQEDQARAIVADFRTQLEKLITDFQAQHPNELPARFTRLTPTIAPTFMRRQAFPLVPDVLMPPRSVAPNLPNPTRGFL
jgi:hypothetical protein